MLTGVLCESEIRRSSPCDANPCESGGTCISLASGDDFLCRCPVNRDGQTCQLGEFTFHFTSTHTLAAVRVQVMDTPITALAAEENKRYLLLSLY